MQAQDTQELIETLREMVQDRGNSFPVRLKMDGAPPQGRLGVALVLLEEIQKQGLPLRGAPWTLQMKDNPVTGAYLEIRPEGPLAEDVE